MYRRTLAVSVGARPGSHRKLLTHGGGYRPTYGSKEHPHLKVHQWMPYYRAIRRYVGKQLRKHDVHTLLLKAEAERFFNGLYVRPQHIRNGTPQERADAILANVYVQQKRRGAFVLRKTITPSLHLLCRVMAVELCLRYSGCRPAGTASRPRYAWVQKARALYHKLLRADRTPYTLDDGHGHVRTVVKFDRLGLTSWNVCKRMSERLEPIYRYWLRDHGRVIAEKVYHAFALEGSATH